MRKNHSRWSPADMASLKPEQRTALLKRGVKKLKIIDVSSGNSRVKKLKFLYYSFIKSFNTNNQTHKNILFIPGGPGVVVDLEDLDINQQGNKQRRENVLEALETHGHNVAYLHVRGSGLSQIPPSNKFDRFLRADYVVEDIERLRLHLLGNDTPWDAIWGESHGALIAQRYAHKYGTARVKKLVLIAPPSRSLKSHDQRRSLMTSNLEAILRTYRGAPSKSESNKKAADLNTPNHDQGDAINDFSFVSDQDIQQIKGNLNQTLEDLDRTYGSMSFVIENYKALKKRDPNLKSFPYPQEFFKALRYLQFYGRPEKNLKFPTRTEQGRFNAALLMAHYLTLPKQQLNARGDRRATLGRSPSIIMGLPPDRRSAYEKRLNEAQENILRDGQLKSRRAYYVFGIYDGISRWILDVMDDQIQKHGFFRSQDIVRRVTGPVARDLVKKIGTIPGEPIYPWNPGYYKHNVATLIVRGDADALTAGGQAESFFEDGLANKSDSVLMEIPGMGHLWKFSMPQAKIGENTLPGDEALQTLVEKFLTSRSAATFLNDLKVKAMIKAIGISIPSAPRLRGAKLASSKLEKLERKKLLDMIIRLRRQGRVTVAEKNRKVVEAPKTKFSRPN